jgi:hypothetical protein
MPPRKYVDKEERDAARAFQQQQRRELQRVDASAISEASTTSRLGRPAKYENAAKAQAAKNERRRLRRKGAGVALQEVTGTPAQSNDTATDDQQLATEVQDTQDFLIDQLEDLSITGVIPSTENREKQADRLRQPLVGESSDEGSPNLLTVTSDVTQLELPQQIDTTDQVSVPTDADVDVDIQVEAYTQADTQGDTQAEAAAERLTQTADERYTVVQEESPTPDALQDEAQIQHSSQDGSSTQLQQQEEARATEVAKDVSEEHVLARNEQVSTEPDDNGDDDAYIDFEYDDAAQESNQEQDLDTIHLREQAIREARQAAADHFHTLTSHRCHNHDDSSTGEEAYIRPKSLWDVAQDTKSLLQLDSYPENGSSVVCHQPLKNQKLPHIDQYANVEWKRLYSADDHASRVRGQLSFKLSQDEALRRLGGKVTLKRRWDVDSVMFRTTTLGVFNEGVELCFYPPYDRSIKQDPHVTFNGYEIHNCKNHLLAYGGSSMIRWDCHLITPNLPKTSRLDTRQFTHELMAFWTDKILLPAVRMVCDSDKTNHLPRNFEEIRTRSVARGETTVVNHYQRAGPTEGSTETVGLGLTRAGKHSSIGCYLQQEDLEDIWKAVLSIIQQGLASESDARFAGFKDCFLVVSSHGTKMATKGREHTLSSARTKFKTLFERAFDTRPEIIPREDFHIDNGHEITPEKNSGLVLLRKTRCLNHLKSNYACQTSGRQKVGQANWKWAMTEGAGTTEVNTLKTNSLRKGGFANAKAYNLNKDVFVGLDRGLAPFSEVKLEGLPFDPDVLNTWLEHNKHGSSQHGGAGPRTRETLLDIMRQIKRRLDNALEASKGESFGVRAEDRMNIELYDLLQEPDSRWLEDITTENIEDEHLPFWILPADHVEAYWRSEIDRWLFGFERQVTIVNRKDHGITSQEQFINSATASIFLRTLQNITSKGFVGKPSQIWKSEYEVPQSEATLGSTTARRRKPRSVKRYGLGYMESLKAWGMPFIDTDLMLWEVLAIQPSKLTKTAFFGSFGFELGFKSKVRQLGQGALKASEIQIRHNREEKHLREYLTRVRRRPGNGVVVQELRHAKRRVDNVTNDIEQAQAQGASRQIITELEERKKEFELEAEKASAHAAQHFGKALRLPTEIIIQQYIRDVFEALAGTGSKNRDAVPGLKNLSKDVLDGRRGLNWLTFKTALSSPGRMDTRPLIARPSLNTPNGKGDGPVFSNVYTHDWLGRMNGLFRINDNVNRHSWENKPYRKKIRHLYALIKQVLTPHIAEVWESELPKVACRYLWAVPSFDSSNFSALEKASKQHSEAKQAEIRAKSTWQRTQIILPRFLPEGKVKYSKDTAEIVELLDILIGAIPETKSKVPIAGFSDEEICQLIGYLRLDLREEEQVSLMFRLKKLLARPHRHMNLVKMDPRQREHEELPNIRTYDHGRNVAPWTAKKGKLPFDFRTTVRVPLLPVFEDLMSLKCLEDFYREVQEAIDKEEEEREEEEIEEEEREEEERDEEEEDEELDSATRSGSAENLE